MSDLKITVEDQIVGGQIYFTSKFSRELTATELAVVPSVNLSRGATRMYALNQLSDHNGSGATWDGVGVHSDIAQSQYRSRVRNDIQKAWEDFKAAIVKANTAQATVAKDTPSHLFFAANGNS